MTSRNTQGSSSTTVLLWAVTIVWAILAVVFGGTASLVQLAIGFGFGAIAVFLDWRSSSVPDAEKGVTERLVSGFWPVLVWPVVFFVGSFFSIRAAGAPGPAWGSAVALGVSLAMTLGYTRRALTGK